MEKFEKVLQLQIYRSSKSRIIRSSFGKRMKSRFESVLDFLLRQTAENCENLEIDCFDFEAVFGSIRRSDVQELISHVTKLVLELENQCQNVNFATYFLTLDGRTSQLL